MSAPTGDSKVVTELNELLGRELGRNEYGKPYFSWRWSEDLFWPAFATGRTLTHETKVLTPIIGAPADAHDFVPTFISTLYEDPMNGTSTLGPCNLCEKPESDISHNVYSIMQAPEREYKSDRQCRRHNTWYACKWLTPWELITGPGRGFMNLKHGEQQSSERAPSHEAVASAWRNQFPGAAFPAKGWRIPTDAYLPNGPTDENWDHSPFAHTTPHRQDTEHFIREVKFQTSRPFAEVERDMLDKEDAAARRVNLEFAEVCRDAFPALLNPAPGTRGRASGGGFVSFPWTKADRQR